MTIQYKFRRIITAFLILILMFSITIPTEAAGDSTIESTSPSNNEIDVELEPTIKITFAYPIVKEDFDASTVIGNLSLVEEVSNNEVGLSLYNNINDGNTKIYIDPNNEKILIIELNDKEENTNGLLNPNTYYTFSMEKDSISLFKNDNKIPSEPVEINFITRSLGTSPSVTAYSSNSSLNDDITQLVKTNLASDGSIYIDFDKEIRLDKTYEWELEDGEDINKYFKLYETTNTTVTESVYGSEVHIYDYNTSENRMLPQSISNISELNNTEKIISKSIGSVELVTLGNQKQGLRITPKNPLDNLNRYKLWIDKRVIEDLNGRNITENIESNFWTKKSSTSINSSWEKVDSIQVKDIESNSPHINMPRYGENLNGDKYSNKRPIEIDIKGEVIPDARENLFKSLDDIKLINYYSNNSKKIDKIVTKYYLNGETKYTKLYIYPEELKYGERYKLKIPEGTFESRSGTDLAGLEFDFIIKSSSGEGRGILKLENNKKTVAELYQEDEWEVTIRGYNFNENINEITIKGIDPSNVVTIEPKYIDHIDVNTIEFKIKDDALDNFLDMFTSYEEDLTLDITIDFSNGNDPNLKDLIVEATDNTPIVIDTYPSEEDVLHDENRINKKTIDSEEIYFLKVTFEDLDLDGDGTGELQLQSFTRLMEFSSVTPEGSSKSLINYNFIRKVVNDQDNYLKYIFEKNASNKEAYLYIPVKALKSDTTYNVEIASGIVENVKSRELNDDIRWSFTTMYTPLIKDILIGSVVEDYDEDEPIIITGENLYNTVNVYFNDIEAESVDVETDDDGNTYLEVYLPDDNDRLEEGIYNIYIENDTNHTRALYGAFSVVKEGEIVPNEEYLEEESDLGEIRKDLKVSEDTLLLESRYSDDSYLEVDLDELIGQNALTRKIIIDGDEDDNLGILKTKSRWGNIDLYNISLDYNAEYEDITITLGRANPSVKQSLQRKIMGQSVKSEFVIVDTENCSPTKIVLNIPFSMSSGKNLKVLRYDEDTRNFYSERFSVNLVDKQVTIESNKAGIFVVIED